jgi:hypothetical protein
MTRFRNARRRAYFRATALLLLVAAILAIVAVPAARRETVAAVAIPAVRAFNTVRPKLNLDNGPACLDRLSDTGVEYLRLANWTDPKGCALDNTVRISRLGEVSLGTPVTLTCRMAVQLDAWQREVLTPAAVAAYSAPIAAIDHIGTFNCRPIRGYKGLLSEHAYANAMDIKGFKLKSGKKIAVGKGWKGESRDAQFLRRVTRGACGYFSTVLSPDDNRAHADHLHFDAGVWRNC